MAATMPDPKRSIKNYLPGLILCAIVTIFSIWAGGKPGISGLGFSALTLAIICGMIIGNTFYPSLHRFCDGGVLFSKQHLLRFGIILYGFRLTFSQIADVGITSVVIDILTLSSTFLLASWIGPKLFGLDKQTSWLIGAGSSICGAAAVLATEPVVKAQASKVTVAVATVVIFGTISIFLYPYMYLLIGHFFGSVENYGIYIGSTVHEVAQVVAAGHAVSPQSENTAVITKMIRVMMLAPFLMLLATRVKQLAEAGKGEAHQNKILIPWFAVFFILVAIFNSFHLLPVDLVNLLVILDNFLLAMAMTALGLTTHASTIKQAGMRPLIMGLVLFIWLIVGGGIINLVIHFLLS